MTDIFSSVLILDSRFVNNKAGSNGGSISVYEGSYAKVAGTQFKDNSAKENGWAIGVFNGAKVFVSNCNFSNNTPNELYKGDNRSAIKLTQ